MSTVDNFIAALHSSGAERLLLASGRNPVLTLNGALDPIPGEPIDRASLEGMILVMGGPAEPGQHEFVYEAPTGPVDVTARITDRLIQAIILPASPGDTGDVDPEDATSGVDAAPSADGGRLDDPAPSAPPPTRTFELGPDTSEPPDAPAPLPGITLPETAAAESEPSSGEDAPPAEPGTAFTEPEISVERPGAGTPADELEPPTPDESEPMTPRESERTSAGTSGGFERTYAFGVSPGELDDAPEIGGSEGVHGSEEALGSEAPEPADRSAVALEIREDAPAMERLFLKMVEHGCSDLHVSAGNPPLFRKDGRITDLGAEPRLSPTQAKALLTGITPEKNRKEFEERNDTDFAYEIPSVARFRCNLFRDRNGMGGVFRQIPTEILTAEQLGLPSQLLDLCALKKGLILVTGPTGSGKSTTLAALIDHINRTRQDHIITIEDPIEFVHQNRQCLINQREVGEHTRSFKVALRAALREDPDIVLVGELRDLETVEIALETAETGHLVFGTLHTNTAPGTVSRLIDQFPSGQQAQIRTMLADTLKAVVAQTLCRKIGGGRVAALETLVVTTAVANLIREDKAYQISSAMQTGRAQGMRTLNDALLELVKENVVTAEEAHTNAVDKSEFVNVLSRNGIEIERQSRVA